MKELIYKTMLVYCLIGLLIGAVLYLWILYDFYHANKNSLQTADIMQIIIGSIFLIAFFIFCLFSFFQNFYDKFKDWISAIFDVPNIFNALLLIQYICFCVEGVFVRYDSGDFIKKMPSIFTLSTTPKLIIIMKVLGLLFIFVFYSLLIFYYFFPLYRDDIRHAAIILFLGFHLFFLVFILFLFVKFLGFNPPQFTFLILHAIHLEFSILIGAFAANVGILEYVLGSEKDQIREDFFEDEILLYGLIWFILASFVLLILTLICQYFV